MGTGRLQTCKGYLDIGTGRVKACQSYVNCHMHVDTLGSRWIQPETGVCYKNQWTCVHE